MTILQPLLALAKEVRQGSFISFAAVSYKWKHTHIAKFSLVLSNVVFALVDNMEVALFLFQQLYLIWFNDKRKCLSHQHVCGNIKQCKSHGEFHCCWNKDLLKNNEDACGNSEVFVCVLSAWQMFASPSHSLTTTGKNSLPAKETNQVLTCKSKPCEA